MRVLLINPPRANEIVGNNPAIIEEERGHNPPLGLLYLAGYLEQHTRHDVAVLDCQVEGLDYRQFRDRVQALRPDVVGITVMSFTLMDVIKSIEAVKDVRPEAKVVLGGPHVHLYPTETIAFADVDCLVLGEGECSFARLLDCIGDVAAMRQVPGLVFRDDNAVVQTAAPPLIEDLDSLPFPARHLVPYKKYNSLLTKGDVATTMFTSRGCPFKCRFCDRPHLGHRFRPRSPRNVVDELEACVEMGIEDFLIYDDTFTANRQRAKDICDEIVRRKLKIGFDIRARVDTIDEELVSKLKRAGCTGIHYGVEAGTERVLDVLNKDITLSQVEQAFALTRRQGISVLAYFMIGNPTETREEIQTTFSVMCSLRPDFVHLTILTPFPGTQVYKDALAKGVIERDVWRDFAANPTPDFTPPHWGEFFTREQLSELLVKGYRSFYLRPAYIVRRLAKLRSYGEFKRKARAGLKVLGMK